MRIAVSLHHILPDDGHSVWCALKSEEACISYSGNRFGSRSPLDRLVTVWLRDNGS